ncbi:uncharacterized protein LOC109814091 [Cajanus cajan]|uniref:C2H2-type domain-containing protein n=1 Tax=Cajanus cajan TaxID=3821 RepID=A0A151S122_CAJCA|nr:uncharacterized protein LOC109814091 [Cajanus cajan]KYP48458.1 hypothetical protein KK1_029833 [Cajanus cajan]
MLEVWLSLKKTLQCKPHPNQVHDPKTIRLQKGNQRTKSGNLESSNTKDFIQGSKRHLKNQPSFKGDIDITHPITHEIVLDRSNSKICRCCPCPQSSSDSKGSEGSHRTGRLATSSKITKSLDYNEASVSSNTRMLVQMDSDGFSTLTCHKCGEKLKNLDAVEAHHISEHSVTELEEDSSRQIIETICGTNSVNSENMLGKIDCILKVLNIPKTFACFEEYREMVKDKADKLQRKHPRCVVDGNELLRFHGTTIACSLGKNSSYSLCTLDYCGICQILRHGFSTNKEFRGALGVYTASTSGKAFDSISIMTSHERPFPRKSVIVCRVIAGRIYSPIEEIEEKVDSEFDSLAEKTSGYSDVEELYVLNPKALLPCFVVIFKQQTAKTRRFNSSFRISSF